MTTTTDRPTRRQIRRRRWVVGLLAGALVIAAGMFANYHLASVPRKADAAAYTAGWIYGDGVALRHDPSATVDRVCPSAWAEAGIVDHPYDHRAQVAAGCADAFAEVAAGR